MTDILDAAQTKTSSDSLIVPPPPPPPPPPPQTSSESLIIPSSSVKAVSEPTISSGNAPLHDPNVTSHDTIGKKKPKVGMIFAGLFFLLLTLPLAVFFVSQQKQLADTRSRAAGPCGSSADNHCGSDGYYECQNHQFVNTGWRPPNCVSGGGGGGGGGGGNGGGDTTTPTQPPSGCANGSNTSCGSITCTDSTQFGTDPCYGGGSCADRATNACASHGGVAGSGGTPPPTGGNACSGQFNNPCCTGKTNGEAVECGRVWGTCSFNQGTQCQWTTANTCVAGRCEQSGKGTRKCNAQGSGWVYYTGVNCTNSGGQSPPNANICKQSEAGRTKCENNIQTKCSSSTLSWEYVGPCTSPDSLCKGTNTAASCLNQTVGSSCANGGGTCVKNGTAGGTQCGCVLKSCVADGQPKGNNSCCSGKQTNGTCGSGPTITTEPTKPPDIGDKQCQNGLQNRDQNNWLICECANGCSYKTDTSEGGGKDGAWVCDQNCRPVPIGTYPSARCSQIDFVHAGTSDYCGVKQVNCDASCQTGGTTSTPPPGSTATPTSTPLPSGPQCTLITVYKDGTALTSDQLAQLKAGDVVKIGIQGDRDIKAHFRVNGAEWTEITSKNDQNEYVSEEFTIPSDKATLTIEAEVFGDGVWK